MSAAKKFLGMFVETEDSNEDQSPKIQHTTLKQYWGWVVGGTAVILIAWWLMFFKTYVTEPGWVTVLIDKPLFFGHEGLRKEVVQPGRIWVWTTTDRWQLSNTPFKLEEPFDDLTTSNNNFIDFASTLTVRIVDHVTLVEKFGVENSNWYHAKGVK